MQTSVPDLLDFKNDAKRSTCTASTTSVDGFARTARSLAAWWSGVRFSAMHRGWDQHGDLPSRFAANAAMWINRPPPW